MTELVALQRKIGAYLSPAEQSEIESAYQYSKNAHDGQFRDSGKPYIQHPLAVADILADWRFDSQSIIAALLHDVVEDTTVSLQQVRDKYGLVIGRLVEGLSKMERIEGIDRRTQEAETFRKILLAAADDWRVLFVKLADRLHNMRTLSAISESPRRKRIALETLSIYAPIAERLGFSPLKDELENLSFRHLRPYRYKTLSKALNRSKVADRQVIGRMEEMIRGALSKYNIAGELEKRRKNLYSVYHKMVTQKLTFRQVEDIIGLRLIVEDRMHCYLALGALHECFTPVPERFKDYIAMPKSNGYQSLHTALLTQEKVRVEIQIRTREMHQVAESGLAAHWIYKHQDASPGASQSEALQKLSGLVRMHVVENEAPSEFMEYLQMELKPDEIYVFTPDGKPIQLPPDATALDFAYAIHTDVGTHAVGVEVNGQSMPLSSKLKSGDQLSVKTDPDSHPMTHWLSIAKTARARSSIRHVLNTTSRSDSSALGKKLFIAALQKIQTAPPLEEIQEEQWRSFLGSYNMQKPEELYLEIGLGKMLPDIAARGLLKRRVRRGKDVRLSPISIVGAGNAAITLSTCCYPLPFESIVGVIQKNRGLVVHADTCPAVNNSPNRRSSEKWIDTAWGEKAAQAYYKGAVVMHCRNRPGLVAAVSSAISGRNINIVNFNLDHGEMSRDSLQVELIVEVHSLPELNDLLHVLRGLDEVIKAERKEPESRMLSQVV